MAECPKCHHHLKMTDWKQTCPYCGANIVLYDLQERLMQEADVAEVQYYYFQKKVDRMKTAFIGSKLAITRIITSLLPVIAIFLPLLKLDLSEPFEPFSGNFGGIQLYKMLGKIDMGIFPTLISQADTKIPVILFAASAVSLILGIIVMLVHFICLTMACSPKGKVRNYTLDIIFLIFSLISMFTIVFIPENPVINASVNFGMIIYVLLVILNFAIDIAVFKQGIKPKHAQCYVGGIPAEEYFKMVEDGIPQNEIRAEMYRRLTAIQEKKDAELKAKQEAEEQKTKQEGIKNG